MKKIMTSFFMAWGMFCSIPCPLKWWDKTLYRGMLLAMPFIGLLIGMIWAAAAWLLGCIGAPTLVCAAILAVLPWVLTGFIHLDGYMDCADAILSRRDLATRRKILKDPHTGSFAVICMVILAMTSFALLGELDLESRWPGLVFIPAISRCCSAAAVLGLEPLETSSYSGLDNTRSSTIAAIVMAIVFAALPAVLLWPFGLCGIMTCAGSCLTIAYCRHDLGGMSGDISGAAVTMGELCGIAALVLI